MENKEPPTPGGGSASIFDANFRQDPFLKHFLSPIEIAAAEAHYEGFEYVIEGIKLKVGKVLAEKLLSIAYDRLKISDRLLKQLTDIKLEEHSEFSEFLSTPVEEIKMTVRVRNGLKSNDCATMLDVAKLGNMGLYRLRNIGRVSIKEVQKIFADRGCLHLLNHYNPL